MKLRRQDDRARELAQLVAKLPPAEAALERATEEAARIGELTEELAGLDADVFLGVADADELERRRADLESRIATVRADRKAGRKLVSTLRSRAADLAEVLAREAEQKTAAAVQERERAVADARVVLDEREREHEAAAEQHADAEHAVRWARAPFDDSVGAALAASDAERARMLAWAVGQATSFRGRAT